LIFLFRLCCNSSRVYPVQTKIFISGNAIRILEIILSTSSRFSSHSGYPPKTEKFLVIPFAQIAFINSPRNSVDGSSPPEKLQVSGF
jgi:hypothetical protein